jgi:small subunit ribosomal protein S6
MTTEIMEKSTYELLYILPNKYSEDEAKGISDKVKAIIAENGGKIILFDDWGKKKLAYQVKGYKHGYYILIEFENETKNLERINMLLRNSGDILRHQILLKIIKTTEQLEAEKKIAEKIAAKKMAQKAEEEQEQAKKEAEEKPKKKKEKLDMEKLDEKLDNILDTNDLL